MLPSQKKSIAISSSANLNLVLNHYISTDSDGNITIKDYEKFVEQLDGLVGSNDASKQMMEQFQQILKIALDNEKNPTGFRG